MGAGLAERIIVLVPQHKARRGAHLPAVRGGTVPRRGRLATAAGGVGEGPRGRRGCEPAAGGRGGRGARGQRVRGQVTQSVAEVEGRGIGAWAGVEGPARVVRHGVLGPMSRRVEMECGTGAGAHSVCPEGLH